MRDLAFKFIAPPSEKFRPISADLSKNSVILLPQTSPGTNNRIADALLCPALNSGESRK
jgi:hypothetical protein